jgi:hypothetical protein
LKSVWGLTAGNEARQKRPLGTSKNLIGFVPVPLIGINTAEDYVVTEHYPRRNVGSRRTLGLATATYASEAHNPPGSYSLDTVGYNLADACAFDDHIWLETDVSDLAAVVLCTEIVY